MSQRARFLLAILVILLLVGVVLGVDILQRRQVMVPAGTSTPLPAGSIPIYYANQLAAGIVLDDLEQLPLVSFVDGVEQKSQDGWLLRDVLLLYVDEQMLSNHARIIVYSTGRGKSIELSWEEIQDEANMVMFDLSNRGTLKLVSLLPELDTRDEWVQDVDKIEIR